MFLFYSFFLERKVCTTSELVTLKTFDFLSFTQRRHFIHKVENPFWACFFIPLAYAPYWFSGSSRGIEKVKVSLKGETAKIFKPFFQSCATRLYTPLCRSVRQSVGPSVRLSVRPSVTLYFFGVYGVFGYTAPAQMLHWPQIWPLPTRTRLG